VAGSVSSRDTMAGGGGVLTLRRRGIFPERCVAAIAILGANGVYGRHLTPRLVAAGHDVRALVRRPEAAGAARACGAAVRIADIFDEASLVAAMEGCAISINLATSLPGPSGRGDYAVNDRVRREGAPNWLKACARAGVRRVIQQSIAMVNAAGEQLADEETPLGPVENPLSAAAIQAAIDMEAAVRGSALDWVILRGGLFYGPGTGFDDDWFARAAAGKLRVPGDGGEFVSLVHISDMAAATVKAVERWPSRQALIVCDDAPVCWRELFGFVAEAAGGSPPQTGGRAGFPSFRVSNAKAKRRLSWAPFYADYRAGLAR
jgi:nucleoside-diphosphate-sugar epimerase